GLIDSAQLPRAAQSSRREFLRRQVRNAFLEVPPGRYRVLAPPNMSASVLVRGADATCMVPWYHCLSTPTWRGRSTRCATARHQTSGLGTAEVMNSRHRPPLLFLFHLP